MWLVFLTHFFPSSSPANMYCFWVVFFSTEKWQIRWYSLKKQQIFSILKMTAQQAGETPVKCWCVKTTWLPHAREEGGECTIKGKRKIKLLEVAWRQWSFTDRKDRLTWWSVVCKSFHTRKKSSSCFSPLPMGETPSSKFCLWSINYEGSNSTGALVLVRLTHQACQGWPLWSSSDSALRFLLC